MNQKFIDLIDNLSFDDVFLVAVSGGPDSMALLHMLKDQSIKIVVCHVNYKTRNESDFEEELVRKYAAENNMIFEYCIATKNDIANFQDSARVFRYAFFKQMYDKYNAKGLIVAHHLDDSLETYLLQKKRKSIVRHYGITYHTSLMEMEVYRPLLDYRKRDLLEFCQKNRVPYSVDYTNNLPKYQRNIIRLDTINNLTDKEFIDLVNEMNKREKENDLFFEKVEELLNKCLLDDFLNVTSFRELSNEYKIYVLYSYLQPLILRSSRALSKRFLMDLINQIEDCQSNKKYIIDKKYFLYQEYNKLHVEKMEEVNYCYYLNKNEEIVTPYFSVSKTGDNKNGIYLEDDEYPIMIRNYRDGDEIVLENGHKKLRRWFIDKKIPLSKRKKIPLLFTQQGKLVYIPCLYKDFERKNLQSTLFMIE